MATESSESGQQSGSEIGRPRLLQRVHEAIRVRHYSRRTEEAYVHWMKRFIFFNGKRHPEMMGEVEVTAFLNHLAAERHVAAATQNQALSAIPFLYREVLGRELPWLDGVQRPSRPPRVPVVLTRAEVERLLAGMTGTRWLIASLLYGAGLRVMECLRLRVKDVDLSYRQVLVRDGKGEKDRVTMLPEKLVEPMRGHLERVRLLHARDLREGYGARCNCLMRSRASIRAPAASGIGNTFSRRSIVRPARRTAWCAATTCMTPCRSARSRRLRVRRASPSR